jgi:serine protease Do
LLYKSQFADDPLDIGGSVVMIKGMSLFLSIFLFGTALWAQNQPTVTQPSVKKEEPAKKAAPAVQKTAAPTVKKPVTVTRKTTPAKEPVTQTAALDAKLVEVSAKVTPSVVSVRVLRGNSENRISTVNNPAFPFNAPVTRPTTILSGSGIILDKRGNIATNYHVVRNAESVIIQLNDQREYSCDIVGTDPATDVAVIRISLNVPPDIVPAVFADSAMVRPGQIAIAVGNSYGFSNTVTMGIISAVGRPGNAFAEVGDFLQTDASLNPGNSGGALADLNGKIMGMNTAIYSRTGGTSGLGFSIPSNTLHAVADRIIAQGLVVRGWSGLIIQELNPDRALKMGLPQKSGAVVADVVKNSPASSAGVATGDVILSVDSRPVKTARDLYDRVMDKKPGDKLSLGVLRNGKKIDLNLFMGNYPDNDIPQSGKVNGRSLGLAVSDVDEETSLQFGIKEKNGVVIVRLDTGLSAEASGLEVGDLVVELDGKPVPTATDFSRVADDLRDKRSVVFLLKRRGVQKFVTVYLK